MAMGRAGLEPQFSKTLHQGSTMSTYETLAVVLVVYVLAFIAHRTTTA